MKLVISPTVIAPARTRYAPPTSSSMLATLGTPSSSASNVLRSRTAPDPRLRSRLAITASRSVSRRSAPNDLTTVTPSKLSCTAELSWPSSSCAALKKRSTRRW